jgi:hypothetical protein
MLRSSGSSPIALSSIPLEKDPHASQVAQRVGVSFSTVWRRAEQPGITLTAGLATMGRRLEAEREAQYVRQCA